MKGVTYMAKVFICIFIAIFMAVLLHEATHIIQLSFSDTADFKYFSFFPHQNLTLDYPLVKVIYTWKENATYGQMKAFERDIWKLEVVAYIVTLFSFILVFLWLCRVLVWRKGK